MFENDSDLKKIVSRLDIDTDPNPDHRDSLRQQMLSVFQQTQKTPPHTPSWQIIGRKIMKIKITKFAAAAVILIAVLIGVNYFGLSIDGTSVAFAQVKKAVNKMPLMHKLLDTNSDGHQRNTENWYYFESKSILSKYTADSKCYKISSLDYNTMENAVYEPNSDVVKVSYRVDVSSTSLPTSPWVVLEDDIKDYERQGALITREKKQFEGKNVDVYYLTIPSNFRKERVEAEFFVNRSNHLPILYKRKFWTPEGQLRIDQVIRFDFPESGPTDIYDLGVSRTTKVVHDLESKERLEKKMELLQDKAVYEKRFKESYRLEEDEVLKYIPLSIAESRIKIDQINNNIRILEREGSSIMPPLSSGEIKRMNEENLCTIFSWNGEKLAEGGRPVFPDGVTLKIALKRIIALPEFQYDDIPESLARIKIPGDWVVRNGAPKEQLLKAFEKVLQDFTNRPIHFEKRQVEHDVIAVRGKFRFKPLTGTYNDKWIHLFSDRLDPDERGGGGTYSLDSFLTQRLAQTQIKQHVVNLTESSENVRIKCGCHMSAYLGKVAPGPERDAKLKQLLANLARQTSLTFTKELRKVNIWSIVQED